MDVPFPRAPSGVAPLTRSPGYRGLVAWVLLSVFAYALGYLVLLALTGVVLGAILTHPPSGQPNGLIAAWTVVAVVAFAAFVFLVKGLIAKPHRQRDRWIELTRAREPTLFAFLERLATEVRAPMPKRVYLVPEVNAAMLLDSNLLSLLWPPRAELLLGMGLLNAITCPRCRTFPVASRTHASLASCFPSPS